MMLPLFAISQVGIGTTTPHASSALDITSENSGLLVPRLTIAQRDAIASPALGLFIFQTNSAPGFYFYNGTAWVPFGGGDLDWAIAGNTIYNENSGNVGVGISTPTSKFHIEATPVVTELANSSFQAPEDVAPLTFTNWARSGDPSPYGGPPSRCAKSNAIGNNQTSSVNYTLTVPAEGANLSFAYKVSSQKNRDFLRFTIDGNVITNWSGEKDWDIYRYSFTSGTYNIKWEYTKDGSGSAGSDTAWIDAVEMTVGNSLFRLVDGTEGRGKVLVSDANGNASWQKISDSTVPDFSNIATISAMEIPVCNGASVGDTGSFFVSIRGVNTTVNWEILGRQSIDGQTVVLGGVRVLSAPHSPERLQVKYDFSPALPFFPDGIIFSGNNYSSFPDTFTLNYANKSASSITMNITRTDRFGDTFAADACWVGQFYFDISITDD